MRWAEIAAELGYYDQAHLDRDFRQFVGLTATAFLSRHRSSRLVARDQVVSFQDTRTATS